MARFRVETTDADTGEEIALEVESASAGEGVEEAARLLAPRRLGVARVTSIEAGGDATTLTEEDHRRIRRTVYFAVANATAVVILVLVLLAMMGGFRAG